MTEQLTYAEVVLLRQTKRIDRLFSYAIPNVLAGQVKVGMKVQVPFGMGNQTHEAIIVNLIDEETLAQTVPLNKIKPIAALCDDSPWLDPNTVALAFWMRNQYVCTYSEAFSLFMPAGTRLKRDYVLCWIEKPSIETLGVEALQCFVKLESKNKPLLSQFEGTKDEKQVQQWLKSGVLVKEEHLFTDIEDAEKYFIDLKLPLDRAEKIYADIPERYVAQKRLLRHVMVYGRTEESMLRQMTGATTSGILKFVEKDWFTREAEVVITLPDHHVFQDERIYTGLSEEQQQAFESVAPYIVDQKHERFLLHGVTGSGKTEVYMEWVDLALQMGKQALMMVPEISLTPQMVDRFRKRFGDKVGVFHSRLSLRQRYDQWQAVKKGQLPIVIGARSAAFSPLFKPGIIIVDECHEASYKSETTPKYHGVELALQMGAQFGAPVVLGSATPTVSQFHEASVGQMTKLRLYKRFNDTGLPTVDLVDMREELIIGNRSIFSRRLHEQIGLSLSNGRQVMLLMNRKGFSTHVACRACGFSMKCPDCEIGLTFHKGASHLRCNYCNYRVSVPKTCPSCGSPYFKHFGTGTEKVLEETAKLFPQAKVDRLDSETVAKKGGLEQILDRFERGETDILIGTQMISKGLDFKNVGLVGVIAADLTLNLPDFHATERTFQLLTQVAGRAGRGEDRGHVVIQTYEPDNYAIQATLNHDFESFFKDEIRVREAFHYPPFYEIASVLVSSPDGVEAQKAADLICKKIRSILQEHDKSSYELFDPNPAVYAKIKNRYRWQIVIKYKEELKNTVAEALRNACFESLNQKQFSDYLRVIVDPSAQSIL